MCVMQAREVPYKSLIRLMELHVEIGYKVKIKTRKEVLFSISRKEDPFAFNACRPPSPPSAHPRRRGRFPVTATAQRSVATFIFSRRHFHFLCFPFSFEMLRKPIRFLGLGLIIGVFSWMCGRWTKGLCVGSTLCLFLRCY